MQELSEEEYQLNARVKKQLMWFGIAGLVMMFAGLTSAYLVSRSDVLWVSINPPSVFTMSSFVILGSSISMIVAVKMAKKGNRLSNLFLALTVVLGMVFCKNQYDGFVEMHGMGMSFSHNKVANVIKNSVYGEDYTFVYKGVPLVKTEEHYYLATDKGMTTPMDDQLEFEANDSASSYFIMLIGIHVAHVLVGILALLFTFVQSLRKKYINGRTSGLEVCAYFWHFVDILWLYLFGFLYFIR